MDRRFVNSPRTGISVFSALSVCVGVLVASSSVSSAAAERPRDQLWVVSCRHVALSRQEADLDQLRYSEHRPDGGWSASSQASFQSANDPSAATCILVLGNGYTASETRARGQTAYRRLVSGMPAEHAVRFVIWSWPSDHADVGPVKDIRIKAGRTLRVAHCFARWLDESPSPSTISLLGTSFGARIVMEALELRAGGRLGGHQLAASSSRAPRRFRVVLISAAIDNDWLLFGHRLDGALSQVDRLLLVNNSSDSVLKRYRWLYGPGSKTAALGSAGLPGGGRLAPEGGRVEQLDAAPVIGRRHGCGPYFDSPQLVAPMQDCLFGDDLFGGKAADPPPAPKMPPAKGAPIPIAARGQGGA